MLVQYHTYLGYYSESFDRLTFGPALGTLTLISNAGFRFKVQPAFSTFTPSADGSFAISSVARWSGCNLAS